MWTKYEKQREVEITDTLVQNALNDHDLKKKISFTL